MEIILGARPYEFVDEATKRNIIGVSIFTAEKDVNGVIGYVSSKVSMSKEEFAAVFKSAESFSKLVMKPVNINYNKRGKPTSFELLQQK